MDHHFWLNRESKILWISYFKFELNLHHTFNEFDQTAATKLITVTGTVSIQDQGSPIFFSPFQLLVVMAAHPSY